MGPLALCHHDAHSHSSLSSSASNVDPSWQAPKGSFLLFLLLRLDRSITELSHSPIYQGSR